MPAVDYSAPADLYPARNRFRKAPLRYLRFDTVAEALRYAMEETPATQLSGMLIESEEQRFEAAQIGELYRSADYPLPRAAVSA